MKKKVNLASFIGILLAAAGFAIDAIQSAIDEKRQQEYIHECVETEVKKYLTDGEEPETETEEDEEEAE